ncbi:hypothetical protein [Streptomyces bobili]|uniref:hypothetical protein n=1 Tax=Streptomyces bobili TaxID=67280 RepID=UPI0037BB3208
MIAPVTHDPLVVNTQDGTVWCRRAVTREGRGLYVLADAPQCCPEFVMATLADLAEHGLALVAFALPVPVGPVPPQPRTEVERLAAEVVRLQETVAQREFDAKRACHEQDEMRERVSEPYGCQHCGIAKRSHGRRWTTGVGVHAWTAPDQGQIAERMRARRTVRLAARAQELARLRTRVEELLVERHSTNDALGDVTVALREREAAPLTVFRAAHDSIVMGHYTTREAAKHHCEASAWQADYRCAVFAWREDEEEGSSELLATLAPSSMPETPTGYAVTELEIASEYDEEADE